MSEDRLRVTYARLKKICCKEYRHTMKIGDTVIVFTRDGLQGDGVTIRMPETYSGVCTVTNIEPNNYYGLIIRLVDKNGMGITLYANRVRRRKPLGAYAVKFEDLTPQEKVMVVTSRITA